MFAEVCDALLAKAPNAKPQTLVFPLDGRHGLAGYALDEATKRGWQFSRHVPAGAEKHLFDVDGVDGCASLSAPDAAKLLQELASAMGEAWNDNEIGESMGIGRQALTLCLKHFGAWHTFTFWILSNYFQACAGTGNGAMTPGRGGVSLACATSMPVSVAASKTRRPVRSQNPTHPSA